MFCAIITGVTWFVNDLLIALRNFRCTFIGSMVALGVSLAAMVPAQDLRYEWRYGYECPILLGELSVHDGLSLMAGTRQVQERGKRCAADGTNEGEKGR